MTLNNSQELANTQTKLRELKTRYEELRLDKSEDPHVRRLTMLSLKRLINQLTEEITRFESRFTTSEFKRGLANDVLGAAAARIRAGLTQKELARRSGVRLETICRIEGGKQKPVQETILRLEAALAAAGRGKSAT